MGVYTEEPFVSIVGNSNCRTAFEIGSRDGIDALSILETYAPDQLYVFEPNPEAAEIARARLIAQERVEFYELACWDRTGMIPFYPVIYSIPWDRAPERNIGASSCFREAGNYGERLIQREIQVRAVRL